MAGPDASAPDDTDRVLVAGVGYRELADFSVGPLIFDELSGQQWPEHVEVEDFSYNPVAVVHTMQERAGRYRRLVLVGATRRGRPAGSVVAYRWDGVLPGEEQIQARVAEAVTGVIDLDNLLVILGQFEVVPPEVIVVEVEPEREAFGEAMSARGAAAFRRALDVTCDAMLAPRLERFPPSSLGGLATGV